MPIATRPFAPRRRARAVLALVTAVGLLAATAPPAAASSCATDGEQAALHVRSLQTWLVVSSLACRSVEAYNDFVIKYRPALQQHGDALIGYFHRAYGGGGTDKLNRYVTRLANKASVLSLQDRDGFCARASAIYAEMQSAVSPDDLEVFSARTVGLLAVEPKSCMSEDLVVGRLN